MSGADERDAVTAPMRFIWHSRFGDVVIEVRGGIAYVNGRLVEPARTDHDLPQQRPNEAPADTGAARS